MRQKKIKTTPDGVHPRRKRKSQKLTEENPSNLQHEKIVNDPENTIKVENSAATTTTTVDQALVAIKKYIVPASRMLRRKTSSIPYLIDSLFQQTGVVAIAGSSDTGKSSFLRQFATSIVLGDSDFLGFRINARYKRVIYVSTEDDEPNMEYLLLKQNPNITSTETFLNLGFIFETSNIFEKIEQILKKFPVDCVIIDAFSDLFGGNMNQANDVRNYLNKFSALSVKYKTLFVFLHHTGKRTEDLPPSKNNVIGSQGFESKMRMVIELRKDFSNPEIRHMCIVKGNYHAQEFKQSSYVLKFDENMRFINLNQRVSFDKLSKPDNTTNVAKEKAIAYKLEGFSLNQIKEKLISDGYSPSRASIGNWTQNINANQAIYGYEDDEPDLINDPEYEPYE